MAHGGNKSLMSENEKEESYSSGLNLQRTSNVWEYPNNIDSEPNNKVLTCPQLLKILGHKGL